MQANDIQASDSFHPGFRSTKSFFPTHEQKAGGGVSHVVFKQRDEAINAASVVIDDPNTALMTERFGFLTSQEGDVYYD